jgi:hypothetical protein
MSVIALFLIAIVLGFGLIFLIAVTAPKPQPIDLRAESNNAPIVELDAEQLGKLVGAILDRMGIEIDRTQGGKNEVFEMRGVNPTPVTGGTFFVHCIPAPPLTGKLDGPAVGAFIRAMRSAYVSKGLLFTSGTFTPDGRLSAEDAPVELFDRYAIMKLVEQYFGQDEPLPQLVANLPSFVRVPE